MRKPRFKLPPESTAVFHCISRIVAGDFLLASHPVKETLREMMRRQAAFCGVRIITYSLMSNHFHILVRIPPQPDLSDRDLLERIKAFYGMRAPETLQIAQIFADGGSLRERERIRLLKRMNDVSVFMKELKQRFSVWFNRKHERFGTLWAERFRSILVEDKTSVVRTVAAYIDLNPVRAGLVEDPAKYRFCGYGEAAAGNSLSSTTHSTRCARPVITVRSTVGGGTGIGKHRDVLASAAIRFAPRPGVDWIITNRHGFRIIGLPIPVGTAGESISMMVRQTMKSGTTCVWAWASNCVKDFSAPSKIILSSRALGAFTSGIPDATM